MRMTYTSLLTKLALVLVWFTVSSQLSLAGMKSRPMNVVFILADDLGWADTTLYGHTAFYQTPNLQRLADRGMTFSHAYSASPLCSPTRSAIMTGLSPARTGITSPSAHLAEVVLRAESRTTAAPQLKATMPTVVTRLSTDYETMAEIFQASGYATGHFGKWHLGHVPYSPLEHGFDVDVPHHPGPGPAGSYVAPWQFKNFAPNSPGEHIEDRMAHEATQWMERNRDKPFFLNYWMFSVHAPFDAKDEYIQETQKRVNPKDAQRSATYAAMIQSMDDAVGKLLDAIDRLGLAENTIIVFTSDNGGNMYNEIDGTVPTSNRPLRGGKATIFEGGTRVPAVIVWPNKTKAGTISDEPIQSEDYLPTFLEGLQLSRKSSQGLDGVSLVPAFVGESLPERSLFQYFPHCPAVPDFLPPSISIHHGDWKLIRIFHGGENGAHRHLLYDLSDDLGEQRDVSGEHTDLVNELDMKIEEFLIETKAALPLANPRFDPAKYDPSQEGKAPLKKSGRVKAKVPAAGLSETDPLLQGWKPRGMMVKISEGTLQASSTENSPFLGFAPGKISPQSVLRFRIRCGGGYGKVAWLSSPQALAKDSPKPSEFGMKAGQWVEIETSVPASENVPGIIRLFLPEGIDTTTEIDWIELKSDGKVRRWDF